MPISASFSIKDLVESLTKEEIDDLGSTGGEFDGDSTWYTYWTVNDDAVRPSHAALHGTVWKIDDPEAPTPPLAYGCRCYIEYCAAPDTPMAKVIPVAKAELSTKAIVYSEYLSNHVDDWKKLGKQALKLSPADRMGYLIDSMKDDGLSGYLAREYAGMILIAIL